VSQRLGLGFVAGPLFLPEAGFNLVSGFFGVGFVARIRFKTSSRFWSPLAMPSIPPPHYEFDPRKLPAEMLQAVGLVVAASAQTEWVVQQLIGGALCIDDVSTTVLTAHMAAPLKDHVARALTEINGVPAPMVDEIDRLLDEVKEATDKRNTLVHNTLVRDPRTGKVYSFRETARGSLQVSMQPISVAEIEQDAARIYEAGMALSYAFERYRHSTQAPDQPSPKPA
jgi:hypothetical protein